MLKCLICFILGWLVSRMMGNGFSVGGVLKHITLPGDLVLHVNKNMLKNIITLYDDECNDKSDDNTFNHSICSNKKSLIDIYNKNY